MPAGQPKTGRSRWRGLTEPGPLEKGMASHFSIFALRTPWTVWKGKMIGYQKRNRWMDGITDSMNVSEWTPGDGDGQGGLACCDSWGCKESDTTEWLDWTELNWTETLFEHFLIFWQKFFQAFSIHCLFQTFPRNLVLISRKFYVETKICVLKVLLITNSASLLLGPIYTIFKYILITY